MPLDPNKLRMVHRLESGDCIAQCPICAAEGHAGRTGDSRGQHLRLFNDGRFACAAHPGDREHRRAIYAVAGDKTTATGQPDTRTARFKQRLSREYRLQREFRAAWPSILRQTWTPEAIRADSPAEVPTNPAAGARALIRLFPARDLVWIGDHKDSGQPRHARHFRPAHVWVDLRFCPQGPRICPCAFKPDTVSRCLEAVRARRFLVIESDALPHPEQGAVFAALQRDGLRLRAVVDTGRRSLHGWFDAPSESKITELRIQFSGLTPSVIDPALFNPAQPCRLPGWPRTDGGNMPTLIYLDP